MAPRCQRSLLIAILLAIAGNFPALAFDFSLGEARTVPNALPGVEIYRYCPDGHISLLPDGTLMQMYWSGSTSFRTRGVSLLEMKDPEPVLTPGNKGECDNGGAWLFSVFRKNGDQLLGFYHAEDHEFSADPHSTFVAWKSACYCTSDDNGKTWTKRGPFLTAARPKPATPTWGGCGDFCVIRDQVNQRWVCFYQEHFLCMAISEDPEAKPGTWKKLHHGEFQEPGLGGNNSPLRGLEKYAGGNPSVHFNTFLEQWVMVWGTWDEGSPSPNSVCISTSDDLLQWSAPRVVIAATGKQRCWYPTIIGKTDLVAGEKASLCYARFANKDDGRRFFEVREIAFNRGP